MTNFDQYLNKTTLLDGGWGTQFQKLGLKPGESCERWNLEHPEHVITVAGSYAKAGSEIILTNTFQGNPYSLARHDLAEQIFEINKLGVELAKKACEQLNTKVFASIGPSGKMLLMGEVTEDELEASFASQIKGILAGKPDAIIAETFADLDEMRILAKAVHKLTDLPLVGSFTFDSGPDKMRTMMGISVDQVINAADEMGLSAVGANCGVGIENYLKIAKAYRDNTKLPIWIKANAGLPEQIGADVIYKQSPEEFAVYAKSLIDLGVNFLGGCCGTTPEHIKQLRQTLDTTSGCG